METKNYKSRFWEILIGIIIGLGISIIIFLLQFSTKDIEGLQNILAYIFGGILGTWLILVPILYLMRNQPFQLPDNNQDFAVIENSDQIQLDQKKSEKLRIQYKFSLMFFAFFVLAMFILFFAYVIWNLDDVINGFWFTVIMLGIGLANLAAIILRSRLG